MQLRSLKIDRFHPEVTHTPKGTELLRNFAVDICEARQHWTMDEFVGKEIARIRALVGEKGQVVGAVSGGVDSTVAAKLMNEAIGPRFHAILVGGRSLLHDRAKSFRSTMVYSDRMKLRPCTKRSQKILAFD